MHHASLHLLLSVWKTEHPRRSVLYYNELIEVLRLLELCSSPFPICGRTSASFPLLDRSQGLLPFPTDQGVFLYKRVSLFCKEKKSTFVRRVLYYLWKSRLVRTFFLCFIIYICGNSDARCACLCRRIVTSGFQIGRVSPSGTIRSLSFNNQLMRLPDLHD